MSLKSAKFMAILAASLLLAGCGVRGPLQMPKADNTPPSENSPAEPTSTASAESGQNKPANAAPKPHQGFILDGLLR